MFDKILVDFNRSGDISLVAVVLGLVREGGSNIERGIVNIESRAG